MSTLLDRLNDWYDRFLATWDGKTYEEDACRIVIREVIAAGRAVEFRQWARLKELMAGKPEDEALAIVKRERANLDILHASLTEERFAEALEEGIPLFAEGGIPKFIADDTHASAEAEQVLDRMRGEA